MREQGGRSEIQAERVEPAEVVRPQLRFDEAGDVGREIEPAVRRRPRGHGQSRTREDRVPSHVVGAGPHVADRGGAAVARRVPPRRRHELLDPLADGGDDVAGGCVAVDADLLDTGLVASDQRRHELAAQHFAGLVARE